MNRLIIVAYSFFLIFLSLFTYLFLDQNLLYFHKFYTGFAFFNRNLTTYLFLFSILSLFIFFYLFLKKKFNLKLLIGITCIILLFSYSAAFSQDIFNYITTAKVTFSYHENPYVIMPIEFKGDPNLLFTHAANKVALYGPLWIIISSIPYFLGLGNFVLTFFSYKLFAIIFYLGLTYLIWKISKNDHSVTLFALNPLVIIEVIIGNHNDIVMMFFALFSFYLLSRKKILYASLFIIASILVKYATVFLLPIFLLTAYKSMHEREINWNKTYLYCAISMMLIFLFSAFREEIYPWYAVWFLTFSSLIPQRKILLYVSLAFSFGLLLRYVPFILTGTYFGATPIIKTIVTFVSVILVIFYAYFKKSYR